MEIYLTSFYTAGKIYICKNRKKNVTRANFYFIFFYYILPSWLICNLKTWMKKKQLEVNRNNSHTKGE